MKKIILLFAISIIYSQISTNGVNSGSIIESAKIVEIINQVNQNKVTSEQNSNKALEICYVKDIKPSGTNGGSAVFTGDWSQKRDINTIEPSLAGCSFITGLNNNILSIIDGQYDFDCESSFERVVNAAKIRVYDISNNAVLINSINKRAGQGDDSISSRAIGAVNVSSPIDIEIQYRVQTERLLDGLGGQDTFGGTDEIYTQCKITRYSF